MSTLTALVAILLWVGAVLCACAVVGFIADPDPRLTKGTRAFGVIVFLGLGASLYWVGSLLWDGLL